MMQSDAAGEVDAATDADPSTQADASNPSNDNGTDASMPDASLDLLDAGSTTGAQDDDFVGHWVIDQPFHALYEATLYDFQASGSLVEVDSLDLGSPDAPAVTGTVASNGVVCTFHDRWEVDAGLLRITVTCSDGRDRVASFGFPADSQGFIPAVETVDGEAGWEHPGFGWSWTRCPDPSECWPSF